MDKVIDKLYFKFQKGPDPGIPCITKTVEIASKGEK